MFSLRFCSTIIKTVPSHMPAREHLAKPGRFNLRLHLDSIFCLPHLKLHTPRKKKITEGKKIRNGNSTKIYKPFPFYFIHMFEAVVFFKT